MNDSLAKQLHDLVGNTKFAIREAVDDELRELEKDVNNLIEKNKNQEKPNNT